MNLTFRLEQPGDYNLVEELTREAFWNQYVPGCDEHYFVHTLRTCPEFIPELDFVAEEEGRLVGNIMFTRSGIHTPHAGLVETITFGPLSVLPEFQNKGVGTALVQHSLKRAKELGYTAVLIYGYPPYYSRFGFKSAKYYGITNENGQYPAAHQALELVPGALENAAGKAFESPAFEIDAAKAEAYDAHFPAKKKSETESQKRFAAMVKTFL